MQQPRSKTSTGYKGPWSNLDLKLVLVQGSMQQLRSKTSTGYNGPWVLGKDVICDNDFSYFVLLSKVLKRYN